MGDHAKEVVRLIHTHATPESVLAAAVIKKGDLGTDVECVAAFSALLKVHLGLGASDRPPANAPCGWATMIRAGCKKGEKGDCVLCAQRAHWSACPIGLVPLVRMGCTDDQLARLKLIP